MLWAMGSSMQDLAAGRLAQVIGDDHADALDLREYQAKAASLLASLTHAPNAGRSPGRPLARGSPGHAMLLDLLVRHLRDQANAATSAAAGGAQTGIGA